MNTPNQPTCPACGYDLSGLVEPETSCICPECSTESDYKAAITPAPRRIAIGWLLLWLLIVPLILTGITWKLMHYTGIRFNNLGDTIAIGTLLIQPVYIPGITYQVLRKDAQLPPKKRYTFAVMACLACSTTAWIWCANTISSL